MKTKKFILLLLLVVALGFAYTKQAKIKRYIAEKRYHSIFVRMGIMKKCYSNKDIDSILAQEEVQDYLEIDQEITLNSLNKLLNNNNSNYNLLKIPLITHHIYFVPTNKTVKLPEFYIEKMKANFDKLNSLNLAWTHYIWTNDSKIFPDDINTIQGVKIKNLDEFKNHSLHRYLIETIEKGNIFKTYLTEASDILRFIALKKYGGIYTDMDYEIYNANALFELMKKFDFIGGRTWAHPDYFIYINAFLASKPEHPITNEMINKFELYNLSQSGITNYRKYPCSILDKVFAGGPILFTAIYFKKNNIDNNNDIILPSWMLNNTKFAHLKNGNCQQLTGGEEFKKKNSNLSQMLTNFVQNFNSKDENNSFGKRTDIYYNWATLNRDKFAIIGADMSCCTWCTNIKNRKYYYWNWPFSLFMAPDED